MMTMSNVRLVGNGTLLFRARSLTPDGPNQTTGTIRGER